MGKVQSIKLKITGSQVIADGRVFSEGEIIEDLPPDIASDLLARGLATVFLDSVDSAEPEADPPPPKVPTKGSKREPVR